MTSVRQYNYPRAKPFPMSQAYSIWLVPDSHTAEYRCLEDLIDEHARKHDAPDFEPHVTVLGGVAEQRGVVEERTREVVRERDPFELEFMGVSCSTTDHQCVFVLVRPSVGLLDVHRQVSESLGPSGGMYVPHLSLVYGGMPLEDRVREVRAIEATGVPDAVRADTVAVVDTAGPVPEWETVAAYSF